MKKSPLSKMIPPLILSPILAGLFAWTLVWRIPNFAALARNTKLTWFGVVSLLIGGLLLWQRMVIFNRFAQLFQPKEEKSTLQRSRLWIYLLTGLMVMILFVLHSDYFDLRFTHTITIENTSTADLRIEKICPTDDGECFHISDAAEAQGLDIEEYTSILQPGQMLEFKHNFFLPPFRQVNAYFICEGDPFKSTINSEESNQTVCGNNPTMISLESSSTSGTWFVILALNAGTLVLSSVIFTFLLIPTDILNTKKIKTFRFHTLLLGLILFAFVVALIDDLTPVPAHTPIAGLLDLLNWDWIPTLSFNSYLTYIFIGLLLVLYYLVKNNKRWLVLLIASYVFLISFDPIFPILLMGVTLITYFSGKALTTTEDAETKKKVFRRGALSILGILLFFKYAPLLWSSAGVWAGVDTVWQRIVLPLGMSFYIFTAFSYLKDVQTGKAPAELHFGKFALYLAYFPKLLIGPIERPKAFLAQLNEETLFNEDHFVIGLSRIGMGLAKRLLLTNRLAVIADTVFAQPKSFTSAELVVGLLAFTFQVYVDFSAYTDIAIGISALFGIQLTENFQQPYFATSIVDFWRRWHISFSTWLRDYVFLPLEFESRRVRTKAMQYFNTLITFLISGMWHGATINFLLWGGLHGVYQIGEDLLSSQQSKEETNNVVTRISKIILTFLLVSLAWVLFRAENFQVAIDFFDGLFNLTTIFKFAPTSFALDIQDFWLAMGLIPLMLLLDLLHRKHNLLQEIYVQPLLVRWIIYLLVIFTTIIFGFYGNYDVDFVYMQF